MQLGRNLVFPVVLGVLVTSVFASFVLCVCQDIWHVFDLLIWPKNPLYFMYDHFFVVVVVAFPLTYFIGSMKFTKCSAMYIPSSLVNSPPFALVKTDYLVFHAFGLPLYALAIGVLAGAKNTLRHGVHHAEYSRSTDKEISMDSFGWVTLGATIAFVAEVLMVSSFMILEKAIHVAANLKAKDQSSRKTTQPVRLLTNYMNMLLVVAGTLLVLILEVFSKSNSTFSVRIAGSSSLILFICAVFNTYGLGGRLANRKHEWQFFQPFTGGAKFIVLQIVSWVLFSSSVLLQVLCIMSTFVFEFEMFVGAMAVAGVLCILSEIVMVISLVVFRKGGDTPLRSSIADALQSLATKNTQLFLAVFFANMPTLASCTFFIPFLLTSGLSTKTALIYGFGYFSFATLFVVSVSSSRQLLYRDMTKSDKEISGYSPKYWLLNAIISTIPIMWTIHNYYFGLLTFYPVFFTSILFYLYVGLTFPGRPEMTGCRIRENLIFRHSAMLECLASYFSGKVIKMENLNPDETYVMAFHPHGILPMTVLWLQLTAQWRNKFPGIYACPMTASIVHQLPFIRDVLQILGGREVTRDAFNHALENKKSVLVVPGGQAEMIESRSGIKQVRLHVGHKGFLRIATNHGSSVVPILSLNEGELMDNVNFPKTQRWFVKNFAAPFPFFPYGRFLMPVPRRVPVTVVVGKPMKLEKKLNPTADEINVVYKKYYETIREMFDLYKVEAHCPDHELIFLGDREKKTN